MTPFLFNEFSDQLKPQSFMLDKGEYLFRQGDAVEYFYQIESGRIKLVRDTIDGSAVLLHIGQAGEAIAEASLFSDHYHCLAKADLACMVTAIKKQTLLDFLQQNPTQMTLLLSVFARQVRDLRAINEIKNIRSANQRILTFIRCNVDSDKVMNLNLSLKDIAQKMGLAHETFYRELKKLQDSGEIIRDDDQIRLP